MTNPYLDLTAAFNAGRRRALVSFGQAVVMHRLAVMSKDGEAVRLPLREAHELVVSRALGVLPFTLDEELPDA